MRSAGMTLPGNGWPVSGSRMIVERRGKSPVNSPRLEKVRPQFFTLAALGARAGFNPAVPAEFVGVPARAVDPRPAAAQPRRDGHLVVFELDSARNERGELQEVAPRERELAHLIA